MLRVIERQLKAEVGENWEIDEHVLQGRNAVRQEHGFPPLGEPGSPPAPEARERPPLWRRVFGG